MKQIKLSDQNFPEEVTNSIASQSIKLTEKVTLQQ